MRSDLLVRSVWERQVQGTFLPLLGALLVMLVVMPLGDDMPLLAAVFATVLVIAGTFSVTTSSLSRSILVIAAATVLVVRWLAHLVPVPGLLMTAHVIIGIYLLLLATQCLRIVLSHRRITRDTVVGSVCGYLLIAYVFAFVYTVVEGVRPGSFLMTTPQPHQSAPGTDHETPALLYFSFVVLTTVGFGDIVPASRGARALVVFEMLAGQLYLAAFVARLVGTLGTDVRRGES
jgi:hypothetical protein